MLSEKPLLSGRGFFLGSSFTFAFQAAAIFQTQAQDKQVFEACNQAGGVLFWPRNGWVCLKPDYVISMSPGQQQRNQF